MVGFGDFFWYLLWIFYFTVYIFMVFLIISDLFRDHKLNGWWKAVWIIFLIFAPFLTALVYVIARGRGYCVAKATVLAAAARALEIPSRLGFADVRNHLATPRLREQMGTDVFYYHGYTELHLDGRWVKATPAFNIELCQRFGVKPLEFDGREDSIFHPLDAEGRQHMEYLHDRGTRDDVPLEELREAMARLYPHMRGPVEGDFHAEAGRR